MGMGHWSDLKSFLFLGVTRPGAALASPPIPSWCSAAWRSWRMQPLLLQGAFSANGCYSLSLCKEAQSDQAPSPWVRVHPLLNWD